MKRELCAAKGITLITVPCWWDGKKERLIDHPSSLTLPLLYPDFPKNNSLVATIQKERPEMLQEEIAGPEEIPSEAPDGFFKEKTAQIEDIGEPVNACFFTLSSVDPTNWYVLRCCKCARVYVWRVSVRVQELTRYVYVRWMFEKYDGVRGFWNPTKKAFYSRRGNTFTSIPQHIIDSMPDIFLDGELW